MGEEKEEKDERENEGVFQQGEEVDFIFEKGHDGWWRRRR